MTEEEQAIVERALVFAKQNRTRIARSLACVRQYPGEKNPVSVFMAGSPGAGKTEVSKAFVAMMQSGESSTLRIDPDDFRVYFPEYTGCNSWLFQRAVTTIVERMLDLVHHQRQSFLLDGTLANLEVARRNVARALGHTGRSVQVIYVYQQPELAWEFVVARERHEGRRIPCSEFVRQFYAAKLTVHSLKREFGRHIHINVIVKDTDGEDGEIGLDLSAEQIDAFVSQPYDPSVLEQLLTECPHEG